MTYTFAKSFSEIVYVYWEFAFMFAAIWDFIVLELALVGFNMIILKKLGKSPGACGSKRNFWMDMTNEGIRKTLR